MLWCINLPLVTQYHVMRICRPKFTKLEHWNAAIPAKHFRTGLRFRSDAFACIWMEVNETKCAVWPRFNTSCNICACKGSARSSSIFLGSEFGSNWYGNIDAIFNYTGADETCCFGKRWGSTETPSKLFANHNALGQLTNHNTFSFSEGGPSSNPEIIEPFVPGWGERYCNNVNYVKNNAFFEPPSMRACFSTPPKQNQDFEKEHNRTLLKCTWCLLKFGIL